LDINLDKIPDQWQNGDSELINMTASVQGIQIDARGESYIYLQNLLRLEKGKKYSVVVKLDRPVDKLALDIVNSYTESITSFMILQAEDENRYTTEVLIENEPKAKGNRLRLFLKSDCVIESILLLEQQ
jgi:hypothetical protein